MIPAEEIERLALSSLHNAVTPDLAATLDISCQNIDGALVSAAGALPGSAIVINRCLGAGLSQPITANFLSGLGELYTNAGVERFFLQLHPDTITPESNILLGKAGLAPARGWQKFSRGSEPLPRTRHHHEIRKIDAERGHDAALILCNAFDIGLSGIPWIQLLPQCPNWHVFMGFDQDQPGAVGAVYIEGDTAWTDFGATDPAFRRRGFQSALLRHRIAFALDMGCRQLFTCTGEAVPGDPQHSYSNILKCGFREDYVRFNYAPA